MCGFSLYLFKTSGDSVDQTSASSDDNHLRKKEYDESVKRIAIRGPDEQTFFTTEIPVPGSMFNERFVVWLTFCRLKMEGLENGKQPFHLEFKAFNRDPSESKKPNKEVIVVANAEIYNHRSLRAEMDGKYDDLLNGSDCSIILPLYLDHGFEGMLNKIDGEFSIVLIDIDRERPNNTKIYVARDQFGKRGLSFTVNNWSLGVSSDEYATRALSMIGLTPLLSSKSHPGMVRKALKSPCPVVLVPASTYGVVSPFKIRPSSMSTVQLIHPNDMFNVEKAYRTTFDLHPDFFTYYRLPIKKENLLLTVDDVKKGSVEEGKAYVLLPSPAVTGHYLKECYSRIRELLTNAVRERITSETIIGNFSSGGLDSALTVAITKRIRDQMIMEGKPLMYPFHTFTISMSPDSTDAVAAEVVAKHCKTTHRLFLFSKEEGFDTIKDVIRVTGSFDTTTIRASVPHYLLSRFVAREYPEVKGLMSSDGSDEVTEGYRGFDYAPSLAERYLWSQFLIRTISTTDVRRTDKCVSANGREARMPFLSTEFVEFYLSLPEVLRGPSGGKMDGNDIEKRLLRDAFSLENSGYDYLPNEILYRRKEAFSDGVSPSKDESWFQIIQQRVDSIITDEELKKSCVESEFIHMAPKTKEDLYIRRIHTELFGRENERLTEWKWLPPKEWIATEDPSARTLSTYSTK